MKRLSALALLAASFFGTVTPTSAQIARDGNYYEETRSIFCTNSSDCILEFSATPQLILFSKINCLINIPSTTTLYLAAFEIRDVSGGATRRREFLPIPSPITAGSISFYSLVTPTDFMVSASKFPVIEVFVTPSTNPQYECKITGRLQ